MTTINVCIPTARRPVMVERLLDNLSKQERLPDEISIVDASTDLETRAVVEKFKDRFAPGVVRYLTSVLGLTLQRNVGIDATSADLVCFLDDDVLLEPDCLQVMERFMNSEEGAGFGGISPMITNKSGREFEKIKRLYHRLGVYEKLAPGTWLYCGGFLENGYIKPFTGILRVDFINGCCMMYRREVFEKVSPEISFKFGGEDKHLSLRVRKYWQLGVLGDAHIVHDHVKFGVRKQESIQAARSMRNLALMIRDCGDGKWPVLRYGVFLIYHLVELMRITMSLLILRKFGGMSILAGQWAGFFWNVLLPPVFPRRSK